MISTVEGTAHLITTDRCFKHLTRADMDATIFKDIDGSPVNRTKIDLIVNTLFGGPKRLDQHLLHSSFDDNNDHTIGWALEGALECSDSGEYEEGTRLDLVIRLCYMLLQVPYELKWWWISELSPYYDPKDRFCSCDDCEQLYDIEDKED